MSAFKQQLKQVTFKQMFMYLIIAICFASSVYWVHNNHSFYERPIAEVIEMKVVETNEMVDLFDNEDLLSTQQIVAELKNGEQKGEWIHLTNEFSHSGAYDQPYEVGDDLFISIDKQIEGQAKLTGTITDVKRDTYLIWIAWVFILTLLLIGKKQGLFSVISLAINAAVLSFALDVYIRTSHINLLFIASIGVLLFTFISLLLVNGFNEKTYAAIVATLLGTFILLVITVAVLWITNEEGIRYEEMQFLTRPPQMIFIAGVLIGSLGAVMDVAITMSSSIFGLYENNHDISVKAMKASGKDIGTDVMGAMTNILFFAYVSGSIPSLILFLKNGAPLGFTLSINLSMELARALAGGIGIVLAIPIGLYTSIFFVNRKREKR